MIASRIRIAMSVALICFLSGVGGAQAALPGINVSQSPLFTTAGKPPLMMMVMSRDEQLFNKAYPDYTDLDGDGKIDTTYQNNFDYSGYFDPSLCYTYSGGQFSTSATATNHVCSGQWSGNFLNWIAMSRLDVVRSVFYGGRRSTDTDTDTVLERAQIPNDLHAWVKVYSGADISSYTPLTGSVSFCNATLGGKPVMRAANGVYSEWAATALNQCNWREDVDSSTNATKCNGGNNSTCDDASKSNAVGAGSSTGDFTVRVQVCNNASVRESFCRAYGTTASPIYKPTGLLQKYGEDGSMRFGLLTGSFSKPRSGGVLRRNIGKFAGNIGTVNAEGCAPGDEVNTTNGKFCNQTGTAEGIVRTMDALQLTQWNGSSWGDCGTYGILNRQGGDGNRYLDDPGTTGGTKYPCSAWGNPLSEMYAEALRYIGAESAGPTSAFTGGTDLDGLPSPIWKDPYRAEADGGSPYCANCSILVLSTGLNSFDSDEIPAVVNLRSASASTKDVGSQEGISGTYLIGRNASGTPGDLAVGLAANTSADLCTAKSVTDFSLVRGLCPDIPSMEGSYLLDGLAFDAWTRDLRPDLASRAINPKPTSYKNKVKTFGISLAENLPKFQIPVSGGVITMSPLCQSNNAGSADALGGANDTKWRSCFLGSTTIGPKTSIKGKKYTYGRALENDGSAGSFTWVWEDSTWGNDHDNDVVTMVTYCVGAKCDKKDSYSGYSGKDICWRTATAGNDGSPVCGANGSPNVGADEVLVRIENMSAYAGNAMLTGYAMTGSDKDGLKRLTLRPGSADNTILTNLDDPPAAWYKPMVIKYKLGTATAKQLENPLFYAAKYGSFKDSNNNGKPDAGEWDSEKAGVPDNFFQVTNPAKLKQQLAKIFDQVIADAKPTASVATSTPRYVAGSTLAYEASYNGKDWTGDLKAYKIDPNGVYTNAPAVWKASEQLPTPANRNIYTSTPQTASFNGLGVAFTKAGLTTAMQSAVMGALDPTIYNIDDVMAFLRGDHSKEQGSVPPGPYRTRSSPIGDVLNSSPAVIGVTSFGYAQSLQQVAPTAASSYQAFVTAKKSVFGTKSENPVVFFGANDGMLHAVNGSLGAGGGKELFAYVPNAALDAIGALASPGYSHHYYVDGSPTVSDAYLGSWKTVLVESTSAGSRSVFALDVTNPSSFTSSNVLWEFNSKSADADAPLMGQFVGRPWVGLADDGNWVAAFGNGYNSVGNGAALFIRNLATGVKIATIPIPAANQCATGEANCVGLGNGLGTAVLVDNDGSGAGDTIYAGDYLGNLWRFDYVGSTWILGNGGKPLFVARDATGTRQAITSGVYAVANPLGGTIVVFGTGRYLDEHDADPTAVGAAGTAQVAARPAVDSVYGILDSRACTNVDPSTYKCTTWSSTLAISGRSDLQAQKILTYTPLASDGTGGTRTATRNAVSYKNGGGAQMGWYLDFSFLSGTKNLLSGERVTVKPDGVLSDVVINTMRPDGSTCEPGVVNGTMVLDALTGAADYIPLPPAGGWGSNPPPPNMAGTETYRGPPQGEPPIMIVRPPIGEVPCLPGSPGCTPPPPTTGVPTSCSWSSPNATGHPPGKPMPCGRISWEQMR